MSLQRLSKYTSSTLFSNEVGIARSIWFQMTALVKVAVRVEPDKGASVEFRHERGLCAQNIIKPILKGFSPRAPVVTMNAMHDFRNCNREPKIP